jgi:hypothetical protein
MVVSACPKRSADVPFVYTELEALLTEGLPARPARERMDLRN